MTLHAVSIDQTTGEILVGVAEDTAPSTTTSAPLIPDFEGEEVVQTKAKITSIGGLEIDDRVFRMDEAVKLVVEARVVGIQHQANAQGKLERVHTFKAIDSMVIDWGMDMDALREALS